MASLEEMKTLKEKLVDKKMPEAQINKIIAYLSGAIRDEVKLKAKGKPTPVTTNSIDTLYTLIFKWWNMGLAVDGVNVVITGSNMAMVTFHGYKNKVLATYPETEFDVQLVREGDQFSVAKESGAVVYSHTMGDPFETEEKKIKGAYVVFKNKRGEFIETLNMTDFEKMKKASKQGYLWGEWASEFWLKSVIKRACKRHFYDIVEEIDKLDNDDYGAGAPIPSPDETAEKKAKVDAALELVSKAPDLAALNASFESTGLMQNKDVVAAYKKRRAELDQPKEDDKDAEG